MSAAGGQLRGGIDLGGTKIQTAIVDAGGKVLGEARQSDADQRAGRRTWPTRWRTRCARRPRPRAWRQRRWGASASALLATPTRRPASSPAPATCPAGREASRSATTLKEALGAEVRVGNDVQVATEAEFHLGAGREFSSLIGVFWGTGVGGGLVLDGKPWLGRGAAGEIGHMVVKRGGAKCPCGRKGCMEAYAGRAAMEAEAQPPARRGRQDRPLQADAKARQRPADQRHLAARARPRRPSRREADRPARSRHWAPGSPPPSTCSTPKR